MDAGCFCVAGTALGAPPGSFCVAGAALGAPQARFAWQAQHLEHLRRAPWKSGSFCVASAVLWSAGCSLRVAGAALGAPQARFAWQAQHLEHLHIELRGSPAASEYYGRRLLLRGRRSAWSTSGSFCVAGAALGAPSGDE